MRHALAALALIAAATTGAAAQEAAMPEKGRLDAVEYIRGLIRNDSYDPRDRERALNGGREAAEAHWRSSIFDGRRTRATRGTGLRLPDLLRPDPQ